MQDVGIIKVRENMIPQLSQSSQRTWTKVVTCIPCLNAEQFIGDIVTRAKKYVHQVVVIDDGSHDGTAAVAKASGALVIEHGTNKGYGEAIKSCLEAARANAADVLVILDGDGQHDPDEIPRLLAPILKGQADLVIGSRFLQPTPMPRYRAFGIRVITFLLNLGSRTKVSDAQSGFGAYHREVLQALSLTEKGMSVGIETLVKARRRGFVIKEVPVSCHYTSSRLDMNAVKHGLGVALATIKFRLWARCR